ncbi:carbohydrate kinase family protein [Pelomyxa schiedti]|nr:carbohydrate kinase family protein [Pelomyxa schiedti]
MDATPTSTSASASTSTARGTPPETTGTAAAASCPTIASDDGPLHVVAIGSVCVDQIFDIDDMMRLEMVDRLGTEKKYLAIEVSTKLNVQNVSFFPGGSAANITVDLAIMGLKTAFFGGIGDDQPGKECVAEFTKWKINTDGLHIFDSPTGVSVILKTPWGREKSIMGFKGASNLYEERYCQAAVLKRAKYFVWTSLTSPEGIAAIEYCCNICADAGVVICGSPSLSIIQNCRDQAILLMKKSFIASMNQEELAGLTDKPTVKAGIKELLKWGVRIIQILTGCGEKASGSVLVDSVHDVVISTSAPGVVITDPTGSGDAAMCGLFYCLINDLGPEVAAKYGVAMATMEGTKVGVRKGIPSSTREIEEFLVKYPVTIVPQPLSTY